jgi:hypothetical protein
MPENGAISQFGDDGAKRHAFAAGRRDSNGQPGALAEFSQDRRDEWIPFGIRAKIGENGPHPFRQGGEGGL